MRYSLRLLGLLPWLLLLWALPTGASPGMSHQSLVDEKPGMAEAAVFQQLLMSEAQPSTKQSSESVTNQSNLTTEADSLLQQGLNALQSGQYQSAIESWQAALEIYRRLNNRPGESSTLGNLGIAFFRLGEYQQAKNFFEQQLVIALEISDRRSEAIALNSLGNTAFSLGEYPQAIDFYQESLETAREIDDPQSEAAALGSLGIVYNRLGEYRRAINFFEQALTIAQGVGARQSEISALGNLGIASYRLDEYQQSIDFFERALAIAKEIGEPQSEVTILGSLGLIYDELGEYQQSIDFHHQSLAIAREISSLQSEATALGNLGIVHYKIEEYQRAIEFLEQTLAISQELNNRQSEATALTNLGVNYLALENFTSAEDTLLNAIYTYEDLPATELSDQSQISFFDTQISAYKYLETALISQNKFEAALEIAERGRTRAFVELLSGKLSSEQIEQEITQSPSFAEIQRISQEQNSTIVEYSISTNASGDELLLYIWLIQPTGKLYFERVPVGDSLTGIADLVVQSREAMNTRGRGGLVADDFTDEEDDATAELRELHRLLIEPISDWLPSDSEQRVVFIPQGELFLVPFPALKDESDTYLIEHHTILTAPSIQALDLTRQQAMTASGSAVATEILAIGNPIMPEVWNPESSVSEQLHTLIGAEREAKAIANFFDSEALIGAQANEQVIKQRISNARIVHFATHGLLEYGIPEDSGVRDVPGAIALTPTDTEDGLLTAAEILELELQAELVVLSACDTGLGRVTGDGVIGLSRSLIAAGTPSVIVSLWSIPDAPTAELMTEFYRQLRQGKDKAQALRQAMLITIEAHPNPRDWAAFTLIGEAE